MADVRHRLHERMDGNDTEDANDGMLEFNEFLACYYDAISMGPDHCSQLGLCLLETGVLAVSGSTKKAIGNVCILFNFKIMDNGATRTYQRNSLPGRQQ